MKTLFAFLLVFVGCNALAVEITLNVQNPQSDSSWQNGQISIQATAQSNYSIAGWVVYLDNNVAGHQSGGNTLNTSISAGVGTHSIVISVWDSHDGQYPGATYRATNVRVTTGGGGGGGDGGPYIPPGATVISNIDHRTPTGYCDTTGCAGGAGWGTQYTALQGNPSLDGESRLFQYDGPSWGNSLWWFSLGANDAARNFVSDFYSYFDSNTVQRLQAAEFDNYQFVGGYNYMMGTECDFAAGVWDIWNEATGHWLHLNGQGLPYVSCSRFQANSWHHIQIYTQTNTSTKKYNYVSITVDGNTTPINVSEPAKNLGWGHNIGIQWQMDINGNGTTRVKEWVDKAKLSYW